LKKYDNFEDAMEPGKSGEIWIRYGKNYAVAFRHIVTTGLNLTQGKIIKKGDVVGYTVDMKIGDDEDTGSFWEMLVAEKRGDKFYFHHPLKFFDDESQSKLIEIWNASRRKDTPPYMAVKNPWGDLEEFEDLVEIKHKMGYPPIFSD